MSKYGNAIGKFELNVGGFDKELTPKVGDGRRFTKILAKGESDKDFLLDEFAIFVEKLITREYPPENDEEKEQLKLYIDMNLSELLVEINIAFGNITRAELEKQKKDLLQAGKKVIKS